jgi:hypothetical protein
MDEDLSMGTPVSLRMTSKNKSAAWWGTRDFKRPYGALEILLRMHSQGFTLGYFHVLPTGEFVAVYIPPIAKCAMDGAHYKRQYIQGPEGS